MKYFLEQCLSSIIRAIQNLEAEVIVIDNCSSDHTLEYLTPRFGQVQFIQNNQNEGFAKANNKALTMCRGKYILFLNPDTLLAENTLEECLKVFSRNQRCGALGVRMLDGKGNFLPESKRAIPTASNTFFKITGLASAFPHSKTLNNYALGNVTPESMQAIPVLSGAFMMVQKKLLDNVHGFDESYFMYGEDIDLSYRLMQTGFENIYAGHIPIIHFKGESTHKNQANYAHRFYGAMNIFVSKYYTGKKNILKRFFLRAGIQGAIFIHKIKRALKSNSTVKEFTDVETYFLLGDRICIDEAKSLCIKSGIRENNIAFIEPGINNATHFDQSAIVFCLGNNTLKDVIQFMQNRKTEQFYFHYLGTNSIIGSSDKNSTGTIIAN